MVPEATTLNTWVDLWKTADIAAQLAPMVDNAIRYSPEKAK